MYAGFNMTVKPRCNLLKNKQHFMYIFQHITTDIYIPCLLDLCKALWEVMKSYYKTIEWHEMSEDPISPIAKEHTGKLSFLYPPPFPLFLTDNLFLIPTLPFSLKEGSTLMKTYPVLLAHILKPPSQTQA